MNDGNLAFYNNIDVAPFQLMARVGGFHTFVDLELIYPFIKDAKYLLELGAGYGRCIEFLLKKEFKGQIIAIEQSPRLVNHLKERFGKNATIVHSDIKKLAVSVNTDVALWMWSGLIDFSKQEQFQCIRNIASRMQSKGRIVIDLPKFGIQTIAEHCDKNHLYFKSPFGILHCYIPTEEEMEAYANGCNLQILSQVEYTTTTGKERMLYILQKNK